MKVKLKKNYKGLIDTKPDLTPDKIYVVIGIEADFFRILDDTDDPVLFSPRIFDVVDATEPDDWLTTYGKDNERYSYPPELNSVGFFEDYHDGKEDVIKTFNEFVRKKHLVC